MSSKKVIKVSNPETGKLISVDGKTFRSLMRNKKYSYDSVTNVLIKSDFEKADLVKADLVKDVKKSFGVETLWEGPPLEKIFHISDVHIPNGALEKGRDKEYEEVFKRLYSIVKEKGQGKDSYVIVITGDLLDIKKHLEPLTILLAREFLLSLARLHRVILIAGNHDMNEYNPESPCSLLAICHELSPRIFYLKDTGIYRAGQVLFAVSSLKDGKFIFFRDIDPLISRSNLVIALYHGSLLGAKTDLGYTIEEGGGRFRKKEDFEGYDLVLLGDIHKSQAMNKERTMAYAGSLLQLNIGESLRGHGILLWDLREKRYEHLEIENPWGFVKVFVKDDEVIFPEKIPMYPRFIVSFGNASREAFSKIREDLEKNYGAIEVREEWHWKRCEEKEMAPLDDFCFIPQEYHQIHRGYFSSSDEGERRGYWWSLERLEFQNMFCYGGDQINFIDFKAGIYNLSAPNRHGKSSLLNIILFCLFETLKGKDCLTRGSSKGYAKIWFLCNSQRYSIERRGKKGARESFKAIFIRLSDPPENLTGKDAKDTKKILEALLGTGDFFIKMNTLIGRDEKSLLKMGPAERMKSLEELFGLQRFELYRKKAKEDSKRIGSKILELETEERILKKDLLEDRESFQQKIMRNETYISSLGKEISEIEEELQYGLSKIDFLKEKISKIKWESSKISPPKETNINYLLEIIAEEKEPISFSSERILGALSPYGGETAVRRRLSSLVPLPENHEELELPPGNLEYWRERVRRGVAELKSYSFDNLSEDFDAQIASLESMKRKNKIIPMKKKEFTDEEIEREERKLKGAHRNPLILSSLLLSLPLEEDEVRGLKRDLRDEIASTLASDDLENRRKLENKILEMKECREHNRQVEILMKEEAENAEHNFLINAKIRFLSLSRDLKESQRNLEIWERKESSDLRFLISQLEKAQAWERYQWAKEELEKLDKWDKLKELKKELPEREEELRNLLERKKFLEDKKFKDCCEIQAKILENKELEQRLAQSLLSEEKRRILQEEKQRLEKEKEGLEGYLAIIAKGGAPLIMLKERLKIFENSVNENFSPHTGYKFRIEENGEHIEIFIESDLGILAPSRLSGAEDAFLSIAIKSSMNALSFSGRSSLFMIDEMLDCLDKNNWREVLPLIFAALKSQYQTILFVSHRKIIQEIVDHRIIIQRKGNMSQILSVH